MKYLILLTLSIQLLTLSTASAAPPCILNHQGRITVSGTNFDGTGHFKFALVNATGSRSFWSNNATSVGGGEPTASVAVAVSKGHYAVALGDTALAGMSASIPAGVFTAFDDVRLRVWFSATGAGGSFEQLAPDRRVASAGYALGAARALDTTTLNGLNAGELLAAARTDEPWRTGSPDSVSLNFLAAITTFDPGIDGLREASSVAVSGGIAFVASLIDDALAVIDISDPASPQFLGAVKNADPGVDGLDGARSVAVSGGLAFVASPNRHDPHARLHPGRRLWGSIGCPARRDTHRGDAGRHRCWRLGNQRRCRK